MTQETRVTTQRTDDRGLALMELETRFAMAVKQRELLEGYIKDRLKPAKHFYTVAEGQKPSLTKEGAELICLPHNLRPRYVIVSGPDSPPMDDAPFQLTVNCELITGEKFGGQGIGSASSMITRKDGTRVQRQKDPGLRHNATLKMACKSAYIAATLNATAASEFFTQDIEDEERGGNPPFEDKRQHWCTEHNRAFFKTAKMKSYAHPVEGSDQWCHEHTDKPSEVAPNPPTPTFRREEPPVPAPAPVTNAQAAFETIESGSEPQEINTEFDLKIWLGKHNITAQQAQANLNLAWAKIISEPNASANELRRKLNIKD